MVYVAEKESEAPSGLKFPEKRTPPIDNFLPIKKSRKAKIAFRDFLTILLLPHIAVQT
jgi:hypothetical protein